MRTKRWLLAVVAGVSLAAAGLSYGTTLVRENQSGVAGTVCPLGGNELPCPNCCPVK